MIPAATSYELRQELEAAAFAVFSGQGFSVVTPANQPQNFQQIRPRIEVRWNIGRANGSRRYRSADTALVYDAWDATMAVQVVNNPTPDGLNQINEQVCAAVKNIASTMAQNSWTDTTNYPNSLISLPLRPAGDSFTPKAADGYEYTILTFSATVAIRPGVW